MTAVGFTVLALFALSVVGIAVVVLSDRSDVDTEDDEHDAVWLAELRALNDAMPYVHKHRARQRKAGVR